jgi:hypothetical protein
MLRNLFLLIIALLIALALTGCESPLDSDAPRIETPLTAAPKVVPSYVQNEFTNGDLKYAIVGTPDIKVDTSSSDLFFWINMSMAKTNPDVDTLIKGFTINTDSVKGNGTLIYLKQGQGSILMDLGTLQLVDIDGITNTVSILIVELPRETGKPRTAELTILVEGNKNEVVAGFGEQIVLGRLRIEI